MPANTIVATRVGNFTSILAGASTSVVPLTAGVAAGKRLVVFACNNTGNTDPPNTCSDSKGNIYTLDAESTALTSRRVAVFSSRLTSALTTSDTVTVTYTTTLPNRRVVTLIAVDTIRAPSIPVTKNSGTTSTALSTPATANRDDANYIVFGVYGWNNTVTGVTLTPGGTFGNIENLESGTGATWRGMGTMWWIASAAGTEASQGTLSASPSSWEGITIGYSQLDAGEDVVPNTADLTAVADVIDVAAVS